MDDKATERIIKIADRNGGSIEPDQVIADARNPKSPLHSYFDWDIERASMEHWREVARRMIRSVEVERIIHKKTVKTIAYIRDPCKTSSEQGYISVDVLRDDEFHAKRALISEFDRAEAALRRALEVAKALELERDVARLLRQLGLTRVKASKRMAA